MKKNLVRDNLRNHNDLVFDEDGNMYVIENSCRVQVLSPQGDHLRFIGESNFSNPVSPAIYNGHLFVTDIDKSCVVVHTLTGKYVTSFAGEGRTECIDIDEDGFIYVSSSRKALLIY